MIDLYRLYPVLFSVLSYLYEVNKKIENRYIKGNSIIIYNAPCIKYDKIHDFHMLKCICDIKLCTFVSNNYLNFNLYLGNTKISDFTINNNKSADTTKKGTLANKKIQIAQTIFFMDDFYTVNRILLYNCGIIVHSNYYGSHIYNYKGERRTIESIDNFDNIQQITYV